MLTNGGSDTSGEVIAQANLNQILLCGLKASNTEFQLIERVM
jgi:hypothetical protein